MACKTVPSKSNKLEAGDVPSEKGKHSNSKQTQVRDDKARVISMRAWKAKKRIQHARGHRNWGKYLVSMIGMACALLSALLAVASCIPFDGQIHAILSAWFFGTIACSFGLWMHVWRDRLARWVLTIGTVALAVSFVAALAKYMSLPH
jgi:hypothetical protein